MHDFKGNEFVIRWVSGSDEEEGGVAAVDYFGVCGEDEVLGRLSHMDGMERSRRPVRWVTT